MKNLFQKSVLLTGTLFIAAGLAACGGTNDVQTPENADKTAIMVKNNESAKPASTPAQPTTETGDKIGVPECDEYVEKYEICIMSKAPEAQRAMLKTTFEQVRQSWKQAAASPQGKAALPNACKQALEIAKQTTIAYGCVW
jgi:hypothetical protein